MTIHMICFMFLAILYSSITEKYYYLYRHINLC